MQTDIEIKQQEMERDNLQRIVGAVEAALAASTPASRASLDRSLSNARAHLSSIEKKISDARTELEHQKQEYLALAEAQTAQETRLNTAEKRNFAGFLKEDFFTKADFGRLEDFYKKTWDRLSEHGKDEMSVRIWGGIRKGQYTFEELPPIVREKELERAHRRLVDAAIGTQEEAAIPQKDREDFVRAYEAGKSDEAAKVLERESFKRAMFNGQESRAREHETAERGHTSEKVAIATKAAIPQLKAPYQAPKGGNGGDDDLNSLGLDDVKLVDVQSPGSSSDIPNARVSRAGKAELTPGG